MEVNKRYIVLSIPDQNMIHIYRTSDLSLYQTVNGDNIEYQNIGETIKI